MVADFGSPINVHGNGNIVAGRDVNIASKTFSIEQVPLTLQAEFQKVEEYAKSSNSADAKRARVRKFAQKMTVAGFASTTGVVVAYLLAMI